MDHSWETNSPEDHIRSPFTELPKYNTLEYRPDDAFENPLGASFVPNSHFDGTFTGQKDLDKSLAGLQINVYSGISDGGLYNDNHGNTERDHIGAESLPLIPETKGSFLPFNFTNNHIHEAQNDLARSENFNPAGPSSPWTQISHSSEKSSANLQQPSTYTHLKSPAATHSQYSESVWETIASPSADDSDTRPMPDDGSASMQSYNDSQTGIWIQEDAYEQASAWPAMRDVHQDDANGYLTMPYLSQNVQEVFARADAATPFGTESYPNEGTQLLGGGVGAEGRREMMAPPSLSQGTTLQFFPPLLEAQSGIAGALDFQGSPVRQTLSVRQPSVPLISRQNSSQGTVPPVGLESASLSAPTIPPTTLTSLPSPADTPHHSADTSTTGTTKCPHKDCQAVFKGPTKNNDSLRRHLKHKHGQEPNLICPMCPTVFRSHRPDNLKRHFANKHPDYLLPASFKVRTRTRAGKSRRPVQKRS